MCRDRVWVEIFSYSYPLKKILPIPIKIFFTIPYHYPLKILDNKQITVDNENNSMKKLYNLDK
jgi:hypothetical protein